MARRGSKLRSDGMTGGIAGGCGCEGFEETNTESQATGILRGQHAVFVVGKVSVSS